MVFKTACVGSIPAILAIVTRPQAKNLAIHLNLNIFKSSVSEPYFKNKWSNRFTLSRSLNFLGLARRSRNLEALFTSRYKFLRPFRQITLRSTVKKLRAFIMKSQAHSLGFKKNLPSACDYKFSLRKVGSRPGSSSYSFAEVAFTVKQPSNIIPTSNDLKYSGFQLANQALRSVNISKFSQNPAEFFDKTLLQFFTFISGSRTLLQFYPFLANGNITQQQLSLYKTWTLRLNFYQKRLGHRFFMEETIHIMHLALSMHDSNLFSRWLGSLIKRISFWKTRAIFRYLLYLFNNFFTHEFSNINCKGLKLRLRGKISAAGNSRKRAINLKFGRVSYSTLALKCSSHDILISTFTGVLNLRVQIFY